MDAGDGPVLVHLHGAGGLRLHRGHDLLALKHRVIVMEMPGFGAAPENTRTTNTRDLAATMAAAVEALGIDSDDLMGTSYGGKVVALAGGAAPRRSVLPGFTPIPIRSIRGGALHRSGTRCRTGGPDAGNGHAGTTRRCCRTPI